MAEPPVLNGGSQFNVTSASPGVALRLRGAGGFPDGVAVTVATAPSPCTFTARTSKMYRRPLCSPSTVVSRASASPATGIHSPLLSTRSS